MFALEGKTGKIVWEFFLAPKVEGNVVRGPLGKSPLDASTHTLARVNGAFDDLGVRITTSVSTPTTNSFLAPFIV